MISGTMVVEESMQLLCRQGDWCVPYNVVYGENPPPPFSLIAAIYYIKFSLER